MANTANFSIYYKARIVKAIGTGTRYLAAFGVTSTGQTPAAPTSATLSNTTRHASTLFKITHGFIAFNSHPTVYATVGAQTVNSAASDQLTIPASTIVHYVGIAVTTTSTLLTYVALTTPDTNYYYEEVGTLTIPSGGYTIRHA